MALPAVLAANVVEPQFFHRKIFSELSDEYIYQTTRMPRHLLQYLHTLIGPVLEPPTKRRQAISAETQLLVALAFYGSGSFQWAADAEPLMVQNLQLDVNLKV